MSGKWAIKRLIVAFLAVWLFSDGSPLLLSGADESSRSCAPLNCTVFSKTIAGHHITAKNLDWPIADGFLIINGRAVERSSLPEPDRLPLTWTSLYGNVSFNQFGLGFPLGGMNEVGFVIEEASYSPSEYPPFASQPIVSEFEWIQYLLDTCESVEEASEKLQKLAIRPLVTGLHYLMSDPSGDVAIAEYLDGQLVLHSGEAIPHPVLVNNTYEHSLRYLAFHSGFGGELDFAHKKDILFFDLLTDSATTSGVVFGPLRESDNTGLLQNVGTQLGDELLRSGQLPGSLLQRIAGHASRLLPPETSDDY